MDAKWVVSKSSDTNITLDLGLEVAMISYYGLIKDEDLTGSPADKRHR